MVEDRCRSFVSQTKSKGVLLLMRIKSRWEKTGIMIQIWIWRTSSIVSLRTQTLRQVWGGMRICGIPHRRAAIKMHECLRRWVFNRDVNQVNKKWLKIFSTAKLDRFIQRLMFWVQRMMIKNVRFCVRDWSLNTNTASVHLRCLKKYKIRVGIQVGVMWRRRMVTNTWRLVYRWSQNMLTEAVGADT